MPTNEGITRSLSSADWHKHVESWRESETSLAAYARLHNLSYSALWYWKRKFEREEQESEATPVIVQVPACAFKEPERVEKKREHTAVFKLSFGLYCLDIPCDFVDSDFMRLLDCLERRKCL